MADLKVLVARRGTAKSKLTIFKNYVDSLQAAVGSDHAPTEVNYIALEERVNRAVDILSEYESCQSELDSVIEEVDFDVHFQYRQQFETTYFDVISKAKKLLLDNPFIQRDDSASHGSNNNGLTSGAGSRHSSRGSHMDQERDRDRVRLPRLNIQPFDGSFDKWLEFYDLFNTSVHSKPYLTNIEKFSYLRGYLKGEAALLIQGFETTAVNYEQAWAQLQKRYQNKKILIHNHIKGIVELPKMIQESATSLRQLTDTSQSHIRALQCLEEPVESWSSMIIYLMTDKFDDSTFKEWELETTKDEAMPTVTQLYSFLERRCQFLNKIDKTEKATNKIKAQNHFGNNSQGKGKTQPPQVSYNGMNKSNCPFCSQKHQAFSCKTFLNLPVSSRINEVKKHRLCLNCLRFGHISSICTNLGNCTKCSKRHNTLLHLDLQPKSEKQISNDSATDGKPIIPPVITNSAQGKVGYQSVIATVIIDILDNNGKPHKCTAFLDSASQGNYMTWNLCKRLKLHAKKISLPIIGIGKVMTESKGMVSATILSRVTDYSANLSFALLDQVSEFMPSLPIDIDSLQVPPGILLADPTFNLPKKIDISIGVDIFWRLICTGDIDHPFIHNTKLGYIISGNIPCAPISPKSTFSYLSMTDLSKQLQQFWEVENCPQVKTLTMEEQICEEHFVKTHKRDSNGRFIVSIPLRDSPESLGDSRQSAEKRFLSLEKRLASNRSLKSAYVNFMKEYEVLGHMDQVSVQPGSTQPCFYLPHHGVFKEESLSTKIRVVFDGSTSSSSGVSINDLQLVGPTIQPDLFTILIRFRQYKYVISSDIAKMYRQVTVDPNQRPLQRILWRENPTDPIKTFQLRTVTYGTASASFLSIRCLFQLAEDCAATLPHVAHVIRNCMYVDDVLCSIDSLDKTIDICKDLIKVMNSACFPLRKWISNDPKILEGINQVSSDSDDILKFVDNERVKTLGLSWSSHSDQLMYQVNTIKICEPTKRNILSVIAQIFDPLGLLSPCIIKAKILLQKIWAAKLEWDELLSGLLLSEWQHFYEGLNYINYLRISRLIACEHPVFVEIHGFSDASLLAYGASIYLRTIDSQSNIYVHLVCAKSRVTPLKQITIPKLELLGAQTLAILMKNVANALDIPVNRTVYWTDSTIVLGWLKRQPNTLDIFVGNRISEIQTISDVSLWRHVPSEDNPSDLLSRGVNPADLQNCPLWWGGPKFLHKPESEWPPQIELNKGLPHLKNESQIPPICQSYVTQLKKRGPREFQICNYSNLTELERIISWCFRFTKNCQRAKSDRIFGSLSYSEIKHAHIALIRWVQKECFPEELGNLACGKALEKCSNISGLNPFIHSDGVLRVGGRLKHSYLSFDQRHPIILPAKHHIVQLIFTREHRTLLHTGPQSLFHSIRQKYWPISGRNLSRKTVHDCVKCFRNKPKALQPMMGDLPQERVIPSPVFSVTGVDYAGPFMVKDRKGRGQTRTKCYLSLFICLSTKAVHLELVSALSTQAFIQALRRFVARRGLPSKIMSDNGTNFVGARSELNELGKFLQTNQGNLEIQLVNHNFNWSFIPAYSPHFGGVWEAGVKSVKYHLRRVMLNSCLTFEELATLFAQIEAILNSRPLTLLPSHSSDLEPLTPGHFLIGQPLTSVPDPCLNHLPESRMNQYQQLQALQQQFWRRWSREYLPDLQCRMKWKEKGQPLEIGDVVLIKDDGLPPMKWMLGRVTELYKGTDSIVRVAALKTTNGEVRRSLTKLCPLPIP